MLLFNLKLLSWLAVISVQLLDKDRSSNAAAFIDRSYNMTVKGNLSDTVHTEQLLWMVLSLFLALLDHIQILELSILAMVPL